MEEKKQIIRQEILDAVSYIILNRSTKTTQQMFYDLRKRNLEREIVYAFPLMYKGEALAFETLLSKEVIRTAQLEREELTNRDIILSMIEESTSRH